MLKIKQIQGLETRLSAIEDFLEARAVFTSPGAETNTTTTLQTKISGTTPSLEAGTYVYDVSFEWSYDIGNSSFIAEFSVDGVSFPDGNNIVLKQEPKESAGNSSLIGITPNWGTDEIRPYSKKFIATHTADGTHDVLLQWRAEAARVEANIKRAVITVKRFDFVAGV